MDDHYEKPRLKIKSQAGALKPGNKNLVKKSQRLLFTTFNCAKSQVIPIMDLHGLKDERLIMALTGLAGGLVNHGSTCGVVIGSGISLAMVRDHELEGDWTNQEVQYLLEQIKEHAIWFEGKFGTSLCRERPELDHEKITVLGLLNPIKVKGCVNRAGTNMERLSHPKSDRQIQNYPHGENREFNWCEHCAVNVLSQIRIKTGIGSPLLERVSIAMDGGIGLNGGGCGALAGGIMAIGLAFEQETIQLNRREVRNMFRSLDTEFFKNATQLTNDFIQQFQFLECNKLTGRNFANWEEFKTHRTSNTCDQINTFVSETTIQIIHNAGFG